MHFRNGREYRLPELPNFSVDGYCTETNTIYEFFGCLGTGIHANRWGMSPPCAVNPWRNDMNEPCRI